MAHTQPQTRFAGVLWAKLIGALFLSWAPRVRPLLNGGLKAGSALLGTSLPG